MKYGGFVTEFYDFDGFGIFDIPMHVFWIETYLFSNDHHEKKEKKKLSFLTFFIFYKKVG